MRYFNSGIRHRSASNALTRIVLAFTIVFGTAMIFTAAKPATSEDAKQTQASANESNAKLDGRWTLNKDQSEDASDKMKSPQPNRNGGYGNGDPGMGDPGVGRRGGMGGIGMGIPGIGGIGGMGGGRRRGQDSGGANSEQQAHVRELLQPSNELTVTRKDPEIDMTDSDYRVRELFTDGRKLDKPKSESTHTQVKAKWDHDALVTDEKGPDGQKVSRSYKLSEDGKQLYETVTVESKSSKTPISVRHVYDRADD